jgi:hypothetical protein
MLPVMVVTLLAMLEGFPVMPHVLIAGGAALFAASYWTTFHLRRRPVEIRVQDGFACVLTAWDLLRGRSAEWEPILDARDYGSWLHLTIGLVGFELERSEWPDYDGLADALSAPAAAE